MLASDAKKPDLDSSSSGVKMSLLEDAAAATNMEIQFPNNTHVNSDSETLHSRRKSDSRDVDSSGDIRTVIAGRHSDGEDRMSLRSPNFSSRSSKPDRVVNEELVADSEHSLKITVDNQDSLKSDGKVESSIFEEEDDRTHHRRDYGRQSSRRDRDERDERDSRDASYRRKDRNRSRSREDRRRHRSREGSVRRKRRRSSSRSKDRSPYYSRDLSDYRNDRSGKRARDNEGSQTAGSSGSKDEVAKLTDRSRFDRQSDSERSTSRKYPESNLPSAEEPAAPKEGRSRGRSPYPEEDKGEKGRRRSPSNKGDPGNEVENDGSQDKTGKFSSSEVVHEDASREKESRSDRRYRSRRSRSRSGSHSKRRRHHESDGHKTRRSRSRSMDNSRHHRRRRSESNSQATESDLRSSAPDRRQGSRSGSQEYDARSEEDRKKNSGDKNSVCQDDRWKDRERYSNSKSGSRHDGENYAYSERESRRPRETGKDYHAYKSAEDADNQRRYRSDSTERNSSSLQDKRHYEDRPSEDKSGYDSSNYAGRNSNSRYYGRGDNYNSRSFGDRRDTRTYRDGSKENFSRNRWQGNVENSGNDERTWNSDRKRDRGERGSRFDNYREQEQNNDDGHKLEDMVTKSLAKIRQDSEREKSDVNDGDNRASPSRGDEASDVDGSCQGDQSAIPVLLSKTSAYNKGLRKDSYNHTEHRGAFDGKREQRLGESNSTAGSSRNYEPLPPHSKPRHQTPGRPPFHGDFRQPSRPRLEFPPRGKLPMPPPPGSLLPPPPLGIRLPPGMVQPGMIVAMRPLGIDGGPRPVDWRVVGPMQHPPPALGPRGQLVQVGGLIRTQVPVEFLTQPPVAVHHAGPPPFRPGMPPPPHSLIPGHPPVPLQALPARSHLQGDPLRMQQPVTLVRTEHIRLPNHERPQALIDVRHLGSSLNVVSAQRLPLPINLAFPPPPIPLGLPRPVDANQGLGYPTSNQVREHSTADSPSTPPPPPPPAPILSGPIDPRLNSLNILRRQPPPVSMPKSPSSTSEESLESDFCPKPRFELTVGNSGLNPGQPKSPQTPERPNSASSFGSSYTPQHITADAYSEALFEDPYHRPVDEPEVTKVSYQLLYDNNSAPIADYNNAVRNSNDASEKSSVGLPMHDEEVAVIPEITNPMASPSDEQLHVGSLDTDSKSALDVSAHTLEMIQVADLKKVLETVRTTALLSEDDSKSIDKQHPNKMDQIAEEVKIALKPHFAKGLVNKDEYKDIMRKAVPKIFSSKSTLDRARIQTFIQEYVNKIVKARKAEKGKKPSGHPQPKHGIKDSKAV